MTTKLPASMTQDIYTKTEVDAETALLQADLLHIQNQQTNGVNGDTASLSWTTLTLNTVVTNEISGASLSTNQITLPAGTYYLESEQMVHNGSATGYSARTRIYNHTGASVLLEGSSGATDEVVTVAKITRGRITLTGTTVISLQGIASNVTPTFGRGDSLGSKEIHSNIMIWKVA